MVISIADARKFLGGISRTTFYVSVLPQLRVLAAEMGIENAVIPLGRRRMVRQEVLQRLIEVGGYRG
jgi:hypothetical protein